MSRPAQAQPILNGNAQPGSRTPWHLYQFGRGREWSARNHPPQQRWLLSIPGYRQTQTGNHHHLAREWALGQRHRSGGKLPSSAQRPVPNALRIGKLNHCCGNRCQNLGAAASGYDSLPRKQRVDHTSPCLVRCSTFFRKNFALASPRSGKFQLA